MNAEVVTEKDIPLMDSSEVKFFIFRSFMIPHKFLKTDCLCQPFAVFRSGVWLLRGKNRFIRPVPIPKPPDDFQILVFNMLIIRKIVSFRMGSDYIYKFKEFLQIINFLGE